MMRASSVFPVRDGPTRIRALLSSRDRSGMAREAPTKDCRVAMRPARSADRDLRTGSRETRETAHTTARGQPMSAFHRGLGSFLRLTGFCLGAAALLYGGSLYTRDWRLAVHEAGPPVIAQHLRPARARPPAL